MLYQPFWYRFSLSLALICLAVQRTPSSEISPMLFLSEFSLLRSTIFARDLRRYSSIWIFQKLLKLVWLVLLSAFFKLAKMRECLFATLFRRPHSLPGEDWSCIELIFARILLCLIPTVDLSFCYYSASLILSYTDELNVPRVPQIDLGMTAVPSNLTFMSSFSYRLARYFTELYKSSFKKV